MRRALFLVTAVATLAALSGMDARPTAATTVLQFSAGADAYVRSDNVNANFGTATSVKVDKSPD
ncbi:MAG: alkaline phosphatase, partial [Chloroflexota bacterium]|nr:alkaline phosphatase [Chloroflexota bacterium]